MNYVGLLDNPEVLLWADKICLPNKDYFSDDIIGKECGLVFSILESYGLVKRYNERDIDFNEYDGLIELANHDIQEIARIDKRSVISNDNDCDGSESFLEGHMYCAPMVASIYSALAVAGEINANCLFTKNEETFLKYKFDTVGNNQLRTMNEVYRRVFDFNLPNESILHEYGTHSGCKVCKRENICNDEYLIDVESKLIDVLNMRNYDEMVQLRNVIDDIIRNRDKLLQPYEPEDILMDLRKKQLEIRKDINLRFKKIKRFANIVTIASIPLGALGVYGDQPELVPVSAAIGGTAKITDELLKHYESKNNWVNFVDLNNSKC